MFRNQEIFLDKTSLRHLKHGSDRASFSERFSVTAGGKRRADNEDGVPVNPRMNYYAAVLSVSREVILLRSHGYYSKEKVTQY